LKVTGDSGILQRALRDLKPGKPPERSRRSRTWVPGPQAIGNQTGIANISGLGSKLVTERDANITFTLTSPYRWSKKEQKKVISPFISERIQLAFATLMR
jgi:hypothetical protein